MAFLAEDGTGNPDSNSLTTVETFVDYCTDRGYAVQAAWDPTRIQVNLIKATDYVSQRYSQRFTGFPAVRGQGCPWPRDRAWKRTSIDTNAEIVYYGGGCFVPLGAEQIAINEIPKDVQRAVCELALIADTADLSPIVKHTDLDIIGKKIGPIEIDYTRKSMKFNDFYLKAVRLLSPFFVASGGQMPMVRG